MSRDKRPRLGRGLASLIRSSVGSPETEPAGQYASDKPGEDAAPPPPAAALPAGEIRPPAANVAVLPLSNIRRNPYQPRRDFDEEGLRALADSIRTHGLLQPVVVGEAGIVEGQACYELIAGERRLRAAQIAGVAEIPAVVRRSTPQHMLEMAVIENIHRTDLNAIERAGAYRDLMDRFSLTQEQAAERVNESRSSLANYLRLLELPEDVRGLIGDGRLSFGHAKVLAGLSDRPDLQSQLAGRAVRDGLSVRDLEAAARESGAAGPDEEPPGEAPAPKARSAYIQDVERQLTEAVGTRVHVRPGRAKHTGRIVIEYYSLEDFDRILASLGATLES